MKGPTQADIAKALGLSQVTVGLALSKTPSPLQQRLRRETIALIREKAREMGYRPHRAAREMRNGKSNLIVHFNFGGYSEISARRSFHIGRLVHEAGYDFRSVEAYWWISDAERVIDEILSLQPEGLVISGSIQAPFTYAHLQTIIDAGIPVVTIGIELPGVPNIFYDVRQAFRDLTTHCLQAGARRLALVIQSEGSRLVGEKLAGFEEALGAVGGVFHRETRAAKTYRLQGPKPQGLVYLDRKNRTSQAVHDGGYQSLQEIMAWPVPPDAVICTNDTYAIGALNYCLRKGIRVPDECMITGFDNLSIIRSLPCTITTVDQPIQEFCQEAMNLLIGQIRAGQPSGETIRLVPCPALLPGESTLNPEPPVTALT